jgi:broad specificity phosphatase PhoE
VTVLHLVRHGQVENPKKIVYGRQRGWRLSDRGRAEAETVARHLGARPLARIYTSPLERAVQTATAIAGTCGGEVEPREGLTEGMLCAPWEGLPWREVRQERAREWAGYLFRPLEVSGVPEDLRAMAARMEAELRAIVTAHPAQQVVAVSHGDPLKAAVLVLTGGDLRELHRTPIPTGGLVSLEVEGRGPARVLERWAPGRARAGG